MASQLSRRGFLKLSGSTVVVGATQPTGGDSGEYPPYPKVGEGILEANGYRVGEKEQDEDGELRWSMQSFDGYEINEKIRSATDGDVTAPMAEIYTFRLGTDGILFEVGGYTQEELNGNSFRIPLLAWLRHRDNAAEKFEEHAESFSDPGFEVDESFNFGLLDAYTGPVLTGSLSLTGNSPPSLSVSAVDDDVYLRHYNLRYPLTNSSATPDGTSEKIIRSEEIACTGWTACWIDDDGYIVGAGGFHPNVSERGWFTSEKSLEDGLNSALGREITIEFDDAIDRQMHQVMESIE